MKLELYLSDLPLGQDHVDEDELEERLEHYNDLFHYYGDYPDQALVELTRFLEDFPGHEALLARRGFLYFTLYQPNAAMADFMQILEADPEHTLALCYRSKLHAKLGAWDEVFADVVQVLGQDGFVPSKSDYKHLYVEMLELRYQVYFQRKDFDAAWQDARQIKSLKNNWKTSKKYAELYYEQGAFSDALTNISDAINKHRRERPYGSIDELVYFRSRVYRALKQFDQELADVTCYLDKQPDDEEVLMRRAVLYERKGNIRHAILDEHKAHEVRKSNGSKEVLPLFYLAKMAFFEGNASTDPHNLAFEYPEDVRQALVSSGINPISLATLSSEHRLTVFDKLDRIDLKRMNEDLPIKTYGQCFWHAVEEAPVDAKATPKRKQSDCDEEEVEHTQKRHKND